LKNLPRFIRFASFDSSFSYYFQPTPQCPKGRGLQDTSKPAKGKRGNKKGKRGREPTIVIVFFHRTTIDRESSQKLN
jgi:hypothetical protein